MLTAGRCISYGNPWSTCNAAQSYCPNVGYQNGVVFNYYGDIGRVIIENYGSTMLLWGGWVNWVPNAPATISPLQSWESSATSYGLTVCKNGVTTGLTCGQVTDPNRPPNNGVSGLVDADLCVQQGDSGSPVTRADVSWAAGIITNGNLAGSCSPYPASYEPIQTALNLMQAIPYGGG